MDCRALQQILSICFLKPTLSEMVTPRITVSWTLSIPGMGRGRAVYLDLGRLIIISMDLAWFNLRLLIDAQAEIMVKFRESAVKAGSRNQKVRSYHQHI